MVTLNLSCRNLDYLISLSDSELAAFLSRVPQDEREAIIRAAHTRVATGTVGCPIQPTRRQAEFLVQTAEEGLFGGAAGPGKSDALILWLAQGRQIRNYSAVIFRRTFPQLMNGATSLWAKCNEYLPTMGAIWEAGKKQWVWPETNATIRMSHLNHVKNLDDHQGPEYHRVAFDEVTQFTEEMWTYLIGRIREAPDFPIPCGIRGATNPGGIGHHWCKRRFVSDEAEAAIKGLTARDPSPRGQIFWNGDRFFIPARVADNPYINIEKYIARLGHLPEVTRLRMMNGDWSVVAGAILDPEHFRYFEYTETHVQPLTESGLALHDPIPLSECRRFATSDLANTIDRKSEARGTRPASNHVIAVWDYHEQSGFLFLRYVWRDQCESPDLIKAFSWCQKHFDVERFYIEDAAMARAVVPFLRSNKIPFGLINPANKSERSHGAGMNAKIERSVPLQQMLDLNQVHFPQYENTWLPEYVNELIVWAGLDTDMDDQVDVTSYAARVVKGLAGDFGGTRPARSVPVKAPRIRLPSGVGGVRF